MANRASKRIGLETSSLLPLLEITPRTLPLQTALAAALGNGRTFVVDTYSIHEARDQIVISCRNALSSLEKAQAVARRDEIANLDGLRIAFIKALAENWYGREETLRWCDALSAANDSADFFERVRDYLLRKKERYLSKLSLDADIIRVDSGEIESYWITPGHQKNFSIEVTVIKNNLSLEEFFSQIQPIVAEVYKEKVTINDVMDFYHLFSLCYDAAVNEIWSCNQKFVRRHERYLRTLHNDKFADVFRAVKIRRIK
jgi:hypothetical protein